MTVSDISGVRTSNGLRALSNSVFGRHYELEIAAALADLGESSTVEEIFLKARERAIDAGLEVPKEGAVRTSVGRLVTAGALSALSSPRPGIPGYFEPRTQSAFWAFASELCRAAQRPGGK